jgi:UDP-glucuronate 4-epimerase
VTVRLESGRPIVVTGAAGFVGSHVMRAFVDIGRRVVATDLMSSAPTAALAGVSSDRLTYVPGDLRDLRTVDALLAAAGGPCDVVHVAALIQLAQLGQTLGESAPTATAALTSLEVNAMASWQLCGRFMESGLLARFLYVSTRSVFGGRAPTETRIAEDSPQQPAGIYGSSKAAAEIGLLALRDQFDIDLVIARITGVFGPWQGPASFIGQAVEAVLAGKPHRTETGGDDEYELTYVKDAVRGIVLLMEARRLQHSKYHLAPGDRLVKLSEVGAAFGAADPTCDVAFGRGAHSASLGRTPLNTSCAADDIGFVTRWALQDAIADYLRIERTGEYGHEAMATDIGMR